MECPCSKCMFPLEESNLEKYRGDTALMIAAANGHNNCTNVWIAAGADVNVVNKEGVTALIAAASWKQDECVQDLI